MNESEYSDFTPKKEAGRTEEYFRALELALSDSNVKNIALTGPYGAGKSSVIYSFIDQHPASTYLNISLAAFAEKVTKKKKNNEQNNSQEKEDNPKLERVNENDDWSLIDVDEEDLEKGILKQLFYKVNYRRIPQSRYRKIHKYGKLRFFGIILAIACLAGGISWLLGYNYVANIYEKAVYRFVDLGIGELTANYFVIMFAIVVIYGVSYVFWLLSTIMHLGSVKLADKFEMTSKSEDKESIFNKNLDEIIYFFESTPYDVVFIEDLDRFKNNEVFIKLRELNALLNSYEMIKRRIVFVYAVRDDMFVDTDRTKFFDFIIPIIPYINSTNSGEIMRDLLEIDNATSERKCPEHEVSDKFITLTSSYISDMRVLTSIINEFWIYKKTIMENQGLKSLRDENMLALMIFKNMYPLEFSMIESESGSIKQAFKDKKDFIDGKVKEKKIGLKSKNDTLDDLHRDILRNASEVKVAFLGYLVDYKGIATSVVANDGRNYSVFEIMQESFDLNIFNSNRSKVSATTNSIPQPTSIIDLSQEPVAQDYFKRYNTMINCEGERVETIKAEISKLQGEIRNLNEESLEQIISEYPEETVLSDDVRQNRLLVFFLRHGYIDEHYSNYINYFHPNSITTEEMNYILGIRDYNAVGDYSYALEHCSKICDRLELSEFDQKEVLNFHILDYYLNEVTEDNKKVRLIKQIVNRSQSSHSFIYAYLERGVNVEKFIRIIAHESQYVWEDFLNDNNLTDENKDKYLSLIIFKCDIEDVIQNDAPDETGEIRNYLENDKMILTKFKHDDASKLIEVIKALKVKFRDIEINGANESVLNYVFDNNNYVLNVTMLNNIFKMKTLERCERLLYSNWTEIRKLGYDPLIQYIKSDFMGYIKEFVVKQELNTEEDIIAINDLLQEMVKNDIVLSTQFIDKERNAYWNNLNDCLAGSDVQARKEVWDHLITNARIDISWDNYIEYYEQYGNTEALQNYANTNMASLMKNENHIELTDEMIIQMLTSHLNDNSFWLLIRKYKLKDFSVELSEFSEKEIRMLLDEKYFDFTVSRYLKLKGLYYQCSIEFAVKYKADFLDNLGECELVKSDILQFLKRSEFTKGEYIQLLYLIASSEVDTELALILRGFEFELPKDYVEAAWEALEEGDKYQLLDNQLIVYNSDEIAAKFGILGGDYKQFENRDKHRFTLHSNDFNKSICNKLLARSFLSSCEEKTMEKFDPVTSQTEIQTEITGYVKRK